MPGRRASEEERRQQILRAAFDVASRGGLDALTVRRVATKAHLSSGLVLFHFTTKGRLIVALLDFVLATTTVLHVTPEIAGIASPLERLLALLRQEMDRLSSEPRRIRLFFDFWARGFTHPHIRRKMQGELDRYREAFRPMADDVLAAEPDRFRHVSPEGLAAVAVSFIKGCAVQSMIDPEQFDIDDYLAAAQGLLGQLASTHARFAKRQRMGSQAGRRAFEPSLRRARSVPD
jgi:AcrR family transcriptional regulator